MQTDPTEERQMTDPDGGERPLALDAVTVMLTSKGELWNAANMVVAAAILVDLTHRGRLGCAGSMQQLEVTVQDASPVGDELLDDALRTVGSGQRKNRVGTLARALPKPDRVLDRLVAEGSVTTEARRKFGMLKVQRHHPTPEAGRDALVATVQEILGGSTTPADRSARLFSVLAISNRLIASVPREQRNDRARRILEVREGIGPDEAAVVSAIDDIVRRAANASNTTYA